MSELNLESWCKSRGIELREARKISTQLGAQYPWIGKAIQGQPTPGLLLARDLILLVKDVQAGRFPVRSEQTRRRNSSV